MDKISIPDSEYYEKLLLDRNIYSPIIKKALMEVEKFIRKKDLILVGGMALDLALRSRGDKI